jgi:hypothetical protein
MLVIPKVDDAGPRNRPMHREPRTTRKDARMYGMVNQALEALVTERFGPETWAIVRQRAGIVDPAFITMKQYPDEVT